MAAQHNYGSRNNIKLNNEKFRSPEICRRTLDSDAIAAHCAKTSRRAKSNEEPSDIESQNKFVDKRWSMFSKNQDNITKQELINNYRLLTNEKLRLERFLSVMTKNNEMARNRLESDLLDAMMCIEDLKQALEIRMARDPHEAEERRYLIRQNKKLLNQLYESAKKIERLEVTKIEMREQLELLDFQIVEVENQKAMIEEEFRKTPSTTNKEIQTEEDSYNPMKLINQLRENINVTECALSNQKAEYAAALAKQTHLDNLVKELRRENIELRDQLSCLNGDKYDDVGNSLAESDKEIVADLICTLKTQLHEQTEELNELKDSLNSFRIQNEQLKFKLNLDESKSNGKNHELDEARIETFDHLTPKLLLPRVDDLLLNQAIKTFWNLLDEKNNELAQMKRRLKSMSASNNNNNGDDDDNDSIHKDSAYSKKPFTTICDSILPKGLNDKQGNHQEITYLNENDFITKLQSMNKIESEELEKIIQNILYFIRNFNQIFDNNSNSISDHTITNCNDDDDNNNNNDNDNISNNNNDNEKPEIVDVTKFKSFILLKEEIERFKLKLAVTECNGKQDKNAELKFSDNHTLKQLHRINNNMSEFNNEEIENQINLLINELKRRKQGYASGVKQCTTGNDEESLVNNINQIDENSSSLDDRLSYYMEQLRELKQLEQLENVSAQLNLSERRRAELEKQIVELNDELIKARSEYRSAETSLSAARRTEAALRRRLLVAMDLPTNSNSSNAETSLVRHSLGSSLGKNCEIVDIVELQADISKLQSINSSLVEAAQIDRFRLCDQALRIEQQDSEQRALLDKIYVLQAAESSAQRSIVRLQALYEDMLREYSESKADEFSWTQRKVNMSLIKSNNHNNNSINTKYVTNNVSVSAEKSSEAHIPNTTGEKVCGSCHPHVCSAVRDQLRLIHMRYSEIINYLSNFNSIDKKGNKSGENGDCENNGRGDNQTQSIISLLTKNLMHLYDLLPENRMEEMIIQTELTDTIQTCLNLTELIGRVFSNCLKQNDLELVQARVCLLEQIASKQSLINGDVHVEDEDHYDEEEDSLLNKKRELVSQICINGEKFDFGTLLMQEKEISTLRRQLRDAQTQLSFVSIQHSTNYPESSLIS